MESYIGNKKVSNAEFDNELKRMDTFFNKMKIIKRVCLGIGCSMIFFPQLSILGLVVLVFTLFWMYWDNKEYGEDFW